MAQCPNCNGPIDADFGLIECPSCQAQLLIQLDGTVEVANGSPAVFDASTSPEPDPESTVNDAVAPTFDEPYEDLQFESSAEQSDDAAAEPEDLFEDQIDESEGEVEQFGAESAEPRPETIADAYPDFDEPEPAPASAPATYVAPNDSPDLSDLAAFGNSDVSSAREGALRYNVRVTGIDTVDVRDAFREALTDRKFVWDTDHIVRSIKNGECTLRDVTATKAHVLISRLRTLPVEIEWEQYAIHQA